MQGNNVNTAKEMTSGSIFHQVWSYMKNYAKKCRTSYYAMLSL